MNCTPCAHNAEHGYDGLDSNWTHCRDCHVTWPASNKWGHCSSCHRTFAGISAFDAHQTAQGGTQTLCGLSDTVLPEESLLGETRNRYEAYEGFNLVSDVAVWGVFWRRAEQFTGGN